MIAFPDTSFLCAIYRRQDNSPAAAAHFKAMSGPLPVSTLLLYEFRQSVRFQVWLHARDRTKGYSQAHCDRALTDLQTDLDTGTTVLVPVEWADVHSRAEDLSKRYTTAGGHRSLDVLHVATSLHLKAQEFLTFDANQRKLAVAEGLKVRP
jgi:predicted nucleic acid-binding protein